MDSKPKTSGYDAFISYSHSHDGRLGPALQVALERFAKPWYRIRALRVFCDKANLAASPELWDSIQEALSSSDWFVLLASKDAAKSPWVNREVRWWIDHRSLYRLLIVATEPGLAWDGQASDWAGSALVPPALRGLRVGEPLWIDLSDVPSSRRRLRIPADRLASLAAAIRGVERDLLVGEHLRRHRQVVRLAGAAITVMAVLTAMSISAGLVALSQRDSAIRQRDIAVSEDLVSTSRNIDGTNPVLARLLAVAAWRLSPSDLTARLARQAMLDAAATPTIRFFDSHLGSIWSVAFSPDGATLAVGSDNPDGSRQDGIQLWNTATGQPIRTLLSSHSELVSSLAFSPDGKILAVGSGDYSNDDGEVGLWNTTTGQPIRAMFASYTRVDSTILANSVNSVAFSPDGKTLAGGTQNGEIRMWNPATGQPIRTLLASHSSPANPVSSVTFSPDGKILASDGDGKVQLWNTATGHQIRTVLARHTNSVSSVAFSPDGRIVAGGSKGIVALWNTITGKPIGRPLTTSPGTRVSSVAFSPDGATIVGIGRDQILSWSLATGQPVSSPLPAGPVSSVTFSPDGKILAGGGTDGEVRLWNTTVLQPFRAFPIASRTGVIDTVTFSPDFKILASGDQDGEGSDGKVQLWSTATGQPIGTPLSASPYDPVNSVAFSPGGKTLASGGGELRLWNTATGQPIRTLLASPRAAVNSVAFSPGGKTLANGDGDGQVRIWNTATGQPIGSPLAASPTDAVLSLVFSPDGKILASGSINGEVRLWNTATGKPIGTPLSIGQSGDLFSVALTFSPDGKTLAGGISSGSARSGETTPAGSNEDRVQLWNTATSQPIRTLFANPAGEVASVAFSPDGKTLAGTVNGQVQLWNTATGQPISTPLPISSTNPADWIAFSPDGKTLAVGTGDGSIHSMQLWNVSYLQNVTSYLCALAGRSLTQKEWARYVTPGLPFEPVCP